MIKKFKRSSTNKNLFFALLLLFVANVTMGVIMAEHSRLMFMENTKLRMLDIANTAADMLDGDVLETITREDLNTQDYQDEYNILSLFQNNIELSYIYTIRPHPTDGSFDFIIDPDTEEPADFGSDVEVTSALLDAANGTPSAEQTPHTDYWGKFYSAYSPVYNSNGKITAIVGVDFDAEIIDKEMQKHIIMILSICAVIMALGVAFALSISHKSRQRVDKINHELEEIKKGFNELNETMIKTSLTKLEAVTNNTQRDLLQTLASGETYGSNEDEISEIGNNLHSMQEDLRRYIKFLNSQTFVDEMTGVGNKPAYQIAIRNLNQMIEEQNTQFTVAFFDINELKEINTHYGFECGDELLLACANALKSVFGQNHVYRVASDEFIVILEDKTPKDTQVFFDTFESELSGFNESHPKLPNLTVAGGMCGYIPNETPNYRQVFIRAESAMRQNKAEFYEKRNHPQPEA